jgi:hypothetical protein
LTVLLAPDVYVNASVALGSPPDKVVQRLLGQKKGSTRTTQWILDRVSAMLSRIPEFKPDAVVKQVDLIKSLVTVVDAPGAFGPDAWVDALSAAAKAANVKRVITDHPDLLAADGSSIEFISTEAWLLEQAMPPPPPGKKAPAAKKN